MRIENRGMIFDTEEDIGITGYMSNTLNMTLRRNAFGFYYSHFEKFDAVGELIKEEIQHMTKEFAEEIMRDAGINDYNIDAFHKQKYLQPTAPFSS